MEVTEADLQMETDSKQNTTIQYWDILRYNYIQSNVQYGGWNQSEVSWKIRECGFWTGSCADAASKSQSSGRGWKVLDEGSSLTSTGFPPRLYTKVNRCKLCRISSSVMLKTVSMTGS